MTTPANAKPLTCLDCPSGSWGVGFVPPNGPKDARLVVVGQGPGEQEAFRGVPFVEQAPAGWRLRRWLRRAGHQCSQILWMNVVQCWLPQSKGPGGPKGNRPPTPDEVAFCYRTHWQVHLVAADPDMVLAVGGPAQQFLTPNHTGQRYLGVVVDVEVPSAVTDTASSA